MKERVLGSPIRIQEPWWRQRAAIGSPQPNLELRQRSWNKDRQATKADAKESSFQAADVPEESRQGPG